MKNQKFNINTYNIRIVLFLLTVILVLSGLSFKLKKGNPPTLSLSQFQTPVLINKADNQVLRICITVPKGNKEVLLKEILLTLDGATHPGDIEAIKIYYCGADSLFDSSRQFGKSMTPEREMHFANALTLKTEKNYFWVSVKLSQAADLLHRINVGCPSVTLKNGKRLKPTIISPSITQRIGVALRKHGDDNVHTFRIPGLTTSTVGTLLAIYDVRRESSRDLQGDIDIGLSRSTDGGQSWDTMQIVLDMGRWGNLPENFNGVSDANVLVDKSTGDIFIAGLWMHGVVDKNGKWVEGLTEKSKDWNHQWRDKGSQPGFDVKQTSQLLITRSTDDGKTWGAPENLTRQLKQNIWWLFAPAPGNGITMADGTLVMPTQGRDENGLPFSNISYSKDHGTTWASSNPAYHNTTESAIVQLQDGALMLNMRDNRNRKTKGAHNGRAIAVTQDLGEKWTEHSTSHGALQEPVCMASLLKHEYHDKYGKKKSVLLFSNPNDQHLRKSFTIKVSFDDGITWPEEYWLLIDSGRGRGYSCLTSIDENHIGILYEGSQADMTFEKFSLEEIIKEK